jgi:dihydrofolate reductase
MRRLTYYVGTTLDGFIAGPQHEMDLFEVTPAVLDMIRSDYPETLPAHVRAQLGVDDTGSRFDTVVMGRGTYEPALQAGITSPYAHLKQYVVSTTLGPSLDPAVCVVPGDPAAAVRELKAAGGGGIWLAGGGTLAGALLGEIDELVLKLYPVVAGSGIPVLATGFCPTAFILTQARTLDGGVVVLSYQRR